MKLYTLVVATLLLNSCAAPLDTLCNDTIKLESRSPSGKYIVTLYERNCGATTDFSTIANLRSASDRFDSEQGDIFVLKGRSPVNLSWSGDTNLHVQCDQCSANRIFKQETLWTDVHITY